MSRRTFIGRSAALAGASALAAAVAPAGPRRRAHERNEGIPAAAGKAPSFELGLASYTFREFGLDEMIEMTVRAGLRRVCLKDVHLPLDSPPDRIRAVARKLREAGLVPYGCGVVYMRTEAEVRRAFEYAGEAGMEIIVGVPDHGLLGVVDALVRETGLKLAVHNHGPGDRLYPTPGSILSKVEGRDPRLGICLDIGHCQRSGIDPSEAAADCGPRLLDVHLKDVTASSAEGGPVEAGRGVVDLARFLRTLARTGYRGTASFEYEKDGRDPLPGLAESVGYVRGLLAGAAVDIGRELQ
jgi:sugar phosphate isomerase/epimerase